MSPLNVHSSVRGLTVTEMMMTVSLVGILTAVALPKIQTLFEHTTVQQARTVVVTRFNLARMAATQGSRTAVFHIAGRRVWVEARPRVTPVPGSSSDTLAAVTDLASQFGVNLSYSADSVVFDPRGMGGSNCTVKLWRGSAQDSVVITAFGKVSR